jgi:hypothetical protein
VGELVVFVRLAAEDQTMVVSRRMVLTALSLGVLSSPLRALVSAAPPDLDEARATLVRLDAALTSLVRTGREVASPLQA